jgi:anaerobic magnesium-protoporphyrin IX monomethyl ester cyclase
MKCHPEGQRFVVLATPAPVSHRTAEENLGLGYLAAILRQNGYEVSIIDGWLEGLSPEEIAFRIVNGRSPLFIGFASYQSNMHRALETISILKAHGATYPVVAGGFGPTFHADEFLQAGFDIVVRGEGEFIVSQLCEHFIYGTPALSQIPNISYVDKETKEINHNPLQPLYLDIDTLPFPARDTIHFAVERKTPLHIVSSRGCAAHCLFCSIVSFQKLAKGPTWRQRSITNFVDELEEITARGGRYFKVIDDSLIEPPRDEQWCTQLADEIEKRGLNIRMRGSIRADRVTDRIIAELKRAGFFSFSCGIENFSATALKRMAKSASVAQNTEALDIFKKYGIYVQAGHILFDYNTTLVELQDNYRLMRQYDWTISKGIFSEMYAAQGTPYTKLLQRKGFIEADTHHLGNYKYPVFDPEARKVYNALKAWHKSHAFIYDMTIDPLSAPKALEAQELDLFHQLYMELRQLDMDFMAVVLHMVLDGVSSAALQQYTNERIEETREWYKRFNKRVEQTYGVTNLIYTAVENPFIC